MKLSILAILVLVVGNLYSQENDCFPVERSQKEWTDGNISVENQTSNSISISKINPNPTDNVTQIVIQLAEPSEIELTAYDIDGKKVSDIFSGEMVSTESTINWDTKDGNGKLLPSGTYFIELKTNNGKKTTRKLLVSR